VTFAVITHKIIKHRFKVKAIAQPTFFPPHNPNVPSLSDHPTPEEYKKYLEEFPIKVGNYITMDGRMLPAELILHVHYVYKVELECPRRGPGAWTNNHPDVFHIIQLDFGTTAFRTPWMRKGNATQYRVLNKEEFERLVVPNNDLIRDYINKHCGPQTLALEAPSAAV
jgi:hypothetical protein